MNKPRPSRGGSVGGGNRATPTREVGENTGGSSTGSMRPSNISRNPVDNSNQTLTSPNRENPNINRSNNGYVPPRVPTRGTNTTERNNNNNTNERPTNVVTRPNQNLNVNPNYGGSRNSAAEPTRTPRVRENRNNSESRPTSTPSYSRPSAPSSSPSRGSSGGGGGSSRPSSSPSSRPSRPR
jgi:hypothetical protein